MVKNATLVEKKLGFQHPLQVIHNYLYPDQGVRSPLLSSVGTDANTASTQTGR